jgi:tetratricopeptide (TPR) repeat protein
MNKNILYILFSFVLLLSTGCDDFLDVVPDNRTELDTRKKMNQLLLGSYPDRSPHMVLEMMSDNADHKTFPATLTYYQPFQEEAYLWKDIKDASQNDNPKDVWSHLYNSTAAANQVLASISEQSNQEEYNSIKAEALLMRAYNHFQLVNMYGKHYQEATAEEDMGIAYMDATEKDLNPHYERESVAEVYRKIDHDIEEALPLVADDDYVYPAYHFNRKAALAFATRFNLFYGNYDKVIKYANELFGGNPSALMRNKYAFKSLTRDITLFAKTFTAVDEKANFLILTAASTNTVFLNYSTGKEYQHSLFIGNNETVRTPGPWGTYKTAAPYTFNIHSSSYATNNYIVMPVLYMQMKYTNPVAKTGVNYSSVLAFWAEETLLCRAEAYVVKGEYDKAVADLDLWMKYQIDPTYYTPLTRASINDYYSKVAYYTPDKPTVKKELHPLNFQFVGNGSEQENFLQCVLHFRRIETLHLGLRWFDVKRMGIVIYRRDLGADGNSDTFLKITDTLPLDDPRRAMQIPPDVISAGMTPTPR